MRLTDLAEDLAPGAQLEQIGLRPGEKLHEEMISLDEGRRVLQLGDGRYVMQPDLGSWGYQPPEGGVPVPEGFRLDSGSNDLWYSVDEIRAMIPED